MFISYRCVRAPFCLRFVPRHRRTKKKDSKRAFSVESLFIRKSLAPVVYVRVYVRALLPYFFFVLSIGDDIDHLEEAGGANFILKIPHRRGATKGEK